MCRSPKVSPFFQVFFNFSFLHTCCLAMHVIWPVCLILLDMSLLNDILGAYKLWTLPFCSFLLCLVTSSYLCPNIFLSFMQKILLFVRGIISGWLLIPNFNILGVGEIRLPVTWFLNQEIIFVQHISYWYSVVLNIITKIVLHWAFLHSWALKWNLVIK